MKKDTVKTVKRENHEYEFPLISAIDGLVIWHDYASMCVIALPEIMGAFNKFAKVEKKTKNASVYKIAKEEAEKGGGAIMDLIALVPKIVNSERLVSLCSTLLAGSKIDGIECDEAGMCEVFQGDPIEVYSALFWAISVNFPKYFDFLSEALKDEEGEVENDLTPDSKWQEAKPKKK